MLEILFIGGYHSTFDNIILAGGHVLREIRVIIINHDGCY